MGRAACHMSSRPRPSPKDVLAADMVGQELFALGEISESFGGVYPALADTPHAQSRYACQNVKDAPDWMQAHKVACLLHIHVHGYY